MKALADAPARTRVFRSCLPRQADWHSPSRCRASSLGGFRPRAFATLLLAGLLASPAAFADGDECGTAPTDGGTVTCDETTYTYQPGSGNSPVTNDDLGIEYSFSGGSNTSPHNYTINIEDDPDTTGSIDVDTTVGSDYGLHGAHSGIGDLTIDMSAGSISTEGLNAAGLFGDHSGSGNLAITLSGGSLTTDNTTTGTTADHEGSGVWARHEGATGTVSVTMSGGSIVTKQDKASGILAQRQASSSCAIDANGVGNCDIAVTMSGGSISLKGDSAHGIFANGYNTGTTPNIVNYVGNIAIAMTGGRIDARGTSSGTGAHGIYGKHEGTTGTLDILVSGNSQVYSDYAEAIRLDAAFAKTLTLNNATIWRWSQGNVISFSDSTDDTLTVAGNTGIEGVVDFGGGTDKFILNTCLQSDVEDSNDTDCHNGTAYGDLRFDHDFRSDRHPSQSIHLEQIDKIGSGLAWIRDLAAPGAPMSLKDGDLRLDGHLDLGEAGELTIHDATRLVFGGTSPTTYGYITANKVKFAADNWQKLYMATGLKLDTGSDVLRATGSGEGKFYASDDTTEVTPGLYDLAIRY